MEAYPRGAVTFLFTDLEGSTQLWQAYPAAMPAAYERHDALLRDAIAMYGGVVYKTIGDAFQVAFPTAPDAVAAALEAQLGLSSEAWPLPEPLRGRMALHTGAVEPAPDGDYRSPVLNRLGRLLAAGHGGQVLLSLPAAELARDHLPVGAGLKDLGEQRLKDLYRPERVFQLLHSDLPADFPALATLASRPNNLSLQPTPLVGREREVAQVVDLLRRDDVRLVTLTGSGGIGKTRLGLQAAADLLEAFPDGVWFVELAPLGDPALVPSAIAGVLGVREEGGRPLEKSVRAHVADKRLLLLLDNFEHVVDAAPLVGGLLTAAAGLKVLTTSRVRLGLRGEHEVPVPPLALPDPKRLPTPQRLTQYEAVRLFVARAEAAKPDFAVTTDNAPVVAEICHRLDGLPLAIELAAARVKLLPPRALLTRLERRLQVLTGGARDLPARQRTLRDAIAWSHDLLSPEEQTLFRRLAVFAGGCSFEAAEAVGDPDGELDAFEGLATLVDQSLVRQDERDGEPHFSMLETVREFGWEQLVAHGEDGELRRRHLDWCMAFVGQAGAALAGPEQGRWLERLETEHDNLRAALGWALSGAAPTEGMGLTCSLVRFWEMRGHLREARMWLDRALAAGGNEPSLDRADVLNGVGELAIRHGEYEQASQAYEEALAIFRGANTQWGRWGVALVLRNLGEMAAEQGDDRRAVPFLEQSLAGWRDLGDKTGMADLLTSLGGVAVAQQEYDRAVPLLEEALGLYQEEGDLGGIANARAQLGWANIRQGNHGQAAVLLRESVVLWANLGDRLGVAECLDALAVVATATGQAARAARLHAVAETVRHRIGYVPPPRFRAQLEGAVAAARGQLGEPAFAAAWEAGRGLPQEEAVAEAVAVADELAGARSEPVTWPAAEKA